MNKIMHKSRLIYFFFVFLVLTLNVFVLFANNSQVFSLRKNNSQPSSQNRSFSLINTAKVNENNSNTNKLQSSNSIIVNDTETNVTFGTESVTAVDEYDNIWVASVMYNGSDFVVNLIASPNNGTTWYKEASFSNSYEIKHLAMAIDINTSNVYIIFQYRPNSAVDKFDIALFRLVQNDFVFITNDSLDQENPSITIDTFWGDLNYIFIAYEQFNTTLEHEIVVERSINHGTSFQIYALRGFNDSYAYVDPSLALDQNLGIYLTYGFGANTNAVYSIILESGNEIFSTFDRSIVVFSSNGSYIVSKPSISVSQDHFKPTKVVIAFELHYSLVDTDIVVAYSYDVETFGYKAIASTTDNEANPKVTVDGMDRYYGLLNNFYVTYTKTNGTKKIFEAQYTRNTNLTNWKLFYSYDLPYFVSNQTSVSISTMNLHPRPIFFTYVRSSCYSCTGTTVFINSITILDPGFKILEPNSNTTWEKNTNVQIQWTTTGNSKFVNIVLYNLTDFKGYIISNLTNTGYYEFTLPDLDYLENTFGYWITIVDSNDSSIHSFSQFFTIAPYDTVKIISFSNPTPVSRWVISKDYAINWICSDTAAKPYRLELWSDSSFNSIIANPVGDNGFYFIWTIPDSVQAGDNYQIKVILLSNESVYAFSSVFKIVSFSNIISSIPSVTTTNVSANTDFLTIFAVFITLRITKGKKIKKGDT